MLKRGVWVIILLLVLSISFASALSLSDITGNVVKSIKTTGNAIGDFFGNLFGTSSTANAIDGDVLWAKNIGGTGVEYGYGTATDTNGNVFATGIFQGTMNIGGTTLISNGGYDIYVIKYDSSGNVLWAKRFGGILDDEGLAIAGGKKKNEKIFTRSFQKTTTFGTNTYTSLGTKDIFIVKLSGLNGDVQWSRQMGGRFAATGFTNDIGYGVAIANNGEIALAGQAAGSVNFCDKTIYLNSGTDTWLAKFNSTGGCLWAKSSTSGWASVSVDSGRGVAVDVNGNILLTGITNGPINLGGGTLPYYGSATPNGYVGKFNSTGGYIWSRSFGNAAGAAGGSAIAANSNGDALITGSFVSGLDFGSEVAIIGNAGYPNAYLAKLSGATGIGIWAKSLAAPYGYLSYGNGVAVDSYNDVLATGAFQNSINPGGSGLISNGGYDIYIVKYDSSGNYILSKSFGNTGAESGVGIAIDANNNAYITGYLTSATIDFGGITVTNAGSWDGFLAKMAGIPPATTPVNGVCGATLNSCTAGTFQDVTDSDTQYLWNCLGINGGTTASCSLIKPTYTLSVSNNPSVGGVITGTGINCGSDCNEIVVTGTSIILTAAANSGYSFCSWTGCDNPVGNQCTSIISSDKTITAVFSSSCTNECSPSGAKQCSSTTAYQTCGNYDADSCLEWSTATSCSVNQYGSTGNCVTVPTPTGLTATAISSSQINLAWNAVSGATYKVYRATTSGAETLLASGITTNSYSNTGLTAGTTYYYKVSSVISGVDSILSNEAFATTSKITPVLSISISPSNSVTQGTQTTSTGNGCPAGLTCTLTRNSATVSNPDIATLAVGTYNYVYSTAGNSQYNPASSSATLVVNAIVTTVNGQCGTTLNSCTAGTLNDIPDDTNNYLWQCLGTGTPRGTDASCSLPKSTTYTLYVSRTSGGSVSSNPAGISCGTDCNEAYVSGTSVTLIASANSGYVFKYWTGDCIGTSSTCTLLMNSDKSTMATFGTGTAGFDFSLSNGGAKSVTQGSNVINIITATLVSGTTQSVTFSASGLPSGVSASFSPTSCNPTCPTTMTITASSTATIGTSTIIVTATGGGVTRTTSFSLTVNSVSGSTIPNAPTGLTATTLSTTSIRINWVDNSNNEDGFNIERAKGTGAFSQVATLGPNTQIYTDTGLRKRSSYSYKVKAYNVAGNSAYSNTATTSTSTSFIHRVGEFFGI